MKPKSVFLKCDICSVCVGPAYVYHDFYDVGIYKLCPLCYANLNKRGYLYLGDKNLENNQILAEIMLLDGTKILVPKKDIE